MPGCLREELRGDEPGDGAGPDGEAHDEEQHGRDYLMGKISAAVIVFVMSPKRVGDSVKGSYVQSAAVIRQPKVGRKIY